MKIQTKKHKVNGKVYKQKFVYLPTKTNMQMGDILVLTENNEFVLVQREHQQTSTPKPTTSNQELTKVNQSIPPKDVCPNYLGADMCFHPVLKYTKRVSCSGDSNNCDYKVCP
jgi:hypothetical protein